MKRSIFVLICSLFLFCCSASGTKVVKPRAHKVWAKGNRYIIDIPIGNRHVRMLERKRTKTVRMK